MMAQELYFPPTTGEWETTDYADIGYCDENIAELLQYLDEGDSKAFILLKDGKIVIEEYFNNHSADMNWYWASAGKSLTALLIGIAQEEGILDIQNLTADYLGNDWADCSSAVQEVKIIHQLTMTSGLDYTVDNEDCTDPGCLQCLNDPGKEWYYHNAPYTLLGNVIANASDENINQYTSTRLTGRVGMNGFWLQVGDNRLYFSTARSMARFGLLMLAGAEWDGEAILSDMTYYESMIVPSQEINPAYGYLWWLNGQDHFRLPGSTLDFNGMILPSAPADTYAAIGANGQYAIVIPSDNVVMIRMGNDPDESLVPINYLRGLMDRYDALSCMTSTHDAIENDVLSIYPTIATDRIYISGHHDVLRYQVYDHMGRILLQGATMSEVFVSQLTSGIYYILLEREDRVEAHSFMKL